MSDFPASDSFNDVPTSIEKPIDTWDVLVDVAATLTQSKYKNDFLMRGMFVLRSFLYDKIDNNLLRATTDIDSDFKNIESWESLVSEIETLLTENSKLGVQYVVAKRRGFHANPNSDSLQIYAKTQPADIRISLDMNIRTWKESQIYMLPQLTFEANTFYTMLCDKISVLTQARLQRRIKDLYDVYLIQRSVDIDMDKLVSVWTQENRTLGEPIAILSPELLPNLKHAFEAYRGFHKSVNFDETYTEVIDFAEDIFQVLYGYDSHNKRRWVISDRRWIY